MIDEENTKQQNKKIAMKKVIMEYSTLKDKQRIWDEVRKEKDDANNKEYFQ